MFSPPPKNWTESAPQLDQHSMPLHPSGLPSFKESMACLVLSSLFLNRVDCASLAWSLLRQGNTICGFRWHRFLQFLREVLTSRSLPLPEAEDRGRGRDSLSRAPAGTTHGDLVR